MPKYITFTVYLKTINSSLHEFSMTYNTFQETFTKCRIIFCRFPILIYIWYKCNTLMELAVNDMDRTAQWMRRLVCASTWEEFDRFWVPISSRAPTAMTYLVRSWVTLENLRTT